MIKLLIEILLLCIASTVYFLVNIQKDKTYIVDELPDKIAEKVKKKNKKKNASLVKEIAYVFVIILIEYLNGARGFIEGYIQFIAIYIAVNLYKYIVIYCLIYANNKKYWIKGTEELESEYKNYSFYLKKLLDKLKYSLPYGFVAGIFMILVCYIG